MGRLTAVFAFLLCKLSYLPAIANDEVLEMSTEDKAISQPEVLINTGSADSALSAQLDPSISAGSEVANLSWPFIMTEPVVIDEDEVDQGGSPPYDFLVLPNVSNCESMAEFQAGEHAGDIMVCVFHPHPFVSPSGTGYYGEIHCNILNMTPGEDEWPEPFKPTKLENTLNGPLICLLNDGGFYFKNNFQTANCTLFSDSNGVIHIQSWYQQQTPSYTRLKAINDDDYHFFWTGHDSTFPFEYALWDGDERFWQSLNPHMCLYNDKPFLLSYVANNEHNPLFSERGAFYAQMLSDPTFSGSWDLPMRVSMPAHGNYGVSTVHADDNLVHMIISSSINNFDCIPFHRNWLQGGRANLFYATFNGTSVSPLVQITDLSSEYLGTIPHGYGNTSLATDIYGNLWIAASRHYGNTHITRASSIDVFCIDSNGSILHDFEIPGPPDPNGFDDEYFPSLKIDSNGIAHLCYCSLHYDPYNSYYYFDTTSPTETLTEWGILNTDLYTPYGPANVYIDSNDNVHFLWTEEDEERFVLLYRRAEPNIQNNGTIHNNELANTSDTVSFTCDATIYPSVTNDPLSLAISCSQPSRVAIDVYDINGRHLGVLENSTYSAGEHTIDRNISDYVDSSGIYLFKIDIQGRVFYRKVVYRK